MSISWDDIVFVTGYIHDIIASRMPHSKSEFFYEKSIVFRHSKDQAYSPKDGGGTPPLPRECRGEDPSPTLSAKLIVRMLY
jgi:hypothetical protein